MQNLVIKFLSTLPYSIARLPYDAAYTLVIFLARIMGIKCWARNSYYFNNFTPGLSDIDFTLVINPDITKKRVTRFIHLYSRLKKLMPFLGELNIYNSEDLVKLSEWINWYEINRDPKMCVHLELQLPQNGDLFIYLLRLLESDAENLVNNPLRRSKKWLRHFQEVGLVAPTELTLSNLIYSIADASTLDKKRTKIAEFLIYYLNHNQKETFHHLHKEGQEKLFITLYPHRWLVAANGEKVLRNTLTNLHFSQAELELIYSQLRWEINGLYSQRFTLSDKFNVIVYIDMIMNFLVLLQDAREEDFIQLTNSFKSLKKILSRA